MKFDPKKAGEEANAMINQLNQPAEAENQPSDSMEAIAQDSANAESEQPIGTEDGVTAEAVTSSTPDTTEQPDPLLAKLEELTKQLSASEQRWRVLQGMVDKKDEEIDNLRTMFAQLASNSEPAKPVEDQGVKAQNLISPEEVKEYGADYIDVMTRVARQVFAAEFETRMGSVQDRFGKLETTVQNVEQHSAKTAQDRFEEKLTHAVADWKTLNTDAGFLGWLNTVEPYSGLSKLDLLRKAYTDLNAERTAAFFMDYKREAGLLPASPDPVAETTVDSPKGSDALAKLVSPGKTKTVTPRQESAKKQWNRAEIAKLYDDKMAGRISPKEFNALEQDLFRAQQEGRIAA